MRAYPLSKLLLLAAGLLAGAVAVAQGSATPSDPVVRDETPQDRNTQRVQHIRVEDAGSRVDEVRAGGETRSITVQPKANVPAYDVRPADVTRPPNPEAAPGSPGPRTWKILNF